MNVKVNIGRKTAEPNQLKPRTGEDSTFDLKIQELAEKDEKGILVESEVKELIEEIKKNPKIQELAEEAEQGIPVESEVKEVIEEVKKNPKMMDAQKKTLKKRFIFVPLLAAVCFFGIC